MDLPIRRVNQEPRPPTKPLSAVIAEQIRPNLNFLLSVGRADNKVIISQRYIKLTLVLRIQLKFVEAY